MAPTPMPTPLPTPAAGQGGHFFPSDQQAGYGYGNQQQWGQPGEPQAYGVAYQPGYDNDPSPFAQQAGQVQQHHGYAEGDMEYGDGGYYEDEEPRRGRRWLLIAVALVGAIGVGGALAYTYRSIVAPKSRLVAAKTDSGIKVKGWSRHRRPGWSRRRRIHHRVAATARGRASSSPSSLPRTAEPRRRQRSRQPEFPG
jgi:hypothetical protein